MFQGGQLYFEKLRPSLSERVAHTEWRKRRAWDTPMKSLLSVVFADTAVPDDSSLVDTAEDVVECVVPPPRVHAYVENHSTVEWSVVRLATDTLSGLGGKVPRSFEPQSATESALPTTKARERSLSKFATMSLITICQISRCEFP